MTTNEFGPVGEETSPRSANIYCLGPISHFPSHSFQFISAREKKKNKNKENCAPLFLISLFRRLLHHLHLLVLIKRYKKPKQFFRGDSFFFL